MRVRTLPREVPIEGLELAIRQNNARRGFADKMDRRNTFRPSGASWPKSVVPIRVSCFAIDDHAPHTYLYLSPYMPFFYLGGFLMEVRDL